MTSIHEHNCCDHAIAPATDAQPSLAVNMSVLILRIDKMDCPTEESLLRKSLEGMAGIDSLDFNLMQRRLTVRHQLSDPAPIIAAVVKLDMTPVV